MSFELKWFNWNWRFSKRMSNFLFEFVLVKRLAALPAALNRSALIDEQIIDCLERLNGMTLVQQPRRTLPDAFRWTFWQRCRVHFLFFSDFVARRRRADRFVLTKRPEGRATVLSNDRFAQLLSNETLDYANLNEGRSVPAIWRCGWAVSQENS